MLVRFRDAMTLFPNATLMYPTPDLALARWKVQVLRAQLQSHRALQMPHNRYWLMRQAEYEQKLAAALQHLRSLREGMAPTVDGHACAVS